MIRLKTELFDDLDSLDGVRTGLQNAVRLEHATIPTYLYSLFSLRPGANAEIAGLIESIVAEEMAHMALAANVLNAIGGSPSIDDPTLLPAFPGPLPGGVDEGLTVHLEPFSKDQVRNTFMVIEHPEHPLDFPTAAAEEEKPQETIGMFYTKISESIGALGDSIFTGDPARQVTKGFSAVEVIPVTDVASAQRAIEIIIEQGEGTSQSPLDPEDPADLAHYYRFAEIAHGRRLVPNPDAPPDAPPDRRYSYTGAVIPFDEAGVIELVKDPKASTYAAGTVTRNLCDNFNYTYTALLKALHTVFNGQPETLPGAIGLMWSLQEQFMEMTQFPVDPNELGSPMAAPSFEYLPVFQPVTP